MVLGKLFILKFHLVSDLTGHVLHSEGAAEDVTAIRTEVPARCL